MPLSQIAKSYHVSYEAVRRVINTARKERLSGEINPSSLPNEDQNCSQV
jgi:DNA-binding transcriptional regulator LsrR (DeoR family)